MDTNRNIRWISIYLGMFSTIAAGLLGLGHMSWNLPMLVAVSALTSIIYTDTLRWFSLHKSLAYIGMMLGAAYAIYEFLRNSGADPLQSVGSLLVYVQIPLFFQKKSKRVFEQMGVFLMLELVVAALVNDNVLYGVLMLPILCIGSATLTALAIYASQLRHNESVSESTGFVARWMHWLGVEHMLSKRSSGVSLTAVSQSYRGTGTWNPEMTRQSRLGVLSMTFTVLVFSVAYFYLVPRLHSGAYELTGWNAGSVGFSERISLRYIGDLLQNDAAVFRMSMRNNKTKSNYRPNQPPYIRATIVHEYVDGPNGGDWKPAETFLTQRGVFGDIPSDQEFDDAVLQESDDVSISVIERAFLGSTVPAIAPFAKSIVRDEDPGFSVCWRDWRMVDAREKEQRGSSKRRFTYRSFAFTNGQDSPILPDMNDYFGEPSRNQYLPGELTKFPHGVEMIRPFCKSVLERAPNAPKDKLSQAIALEDYLANSNNFKYTLHLTKQVDDTIDPIADFLLNKRQGHCQYFASSLVLLLRSLDIPARLVVGFRPGEYNEVGQFFLVQQKHTHTWVEAYFTREQFEAKSIPLPSYVTHGAWLRLDPTPPGDESNAGGTFRVSSGQTLDAMQDLWNDLVMNRDKSRQSGILSLFGESSGASYANYWLQIQTVVSQMQSSRFIGGILSPEKWFSWRVAFAIISIGAGAAIAFQLISVYFPSWIPRWGRKRSEAQNRLSKIDFYNRAVKALKRFGLAREPWQTQREFFVDAQHQLAAISIPLDADLISRVFYELRFGEPQAVSVEERDQIDRQLKTIERSSREQSWLKPRNERPLQNDSTNEQKTTP